METLQVILFIMLFLAMAVAMFFRKIPALIALPVMAFVIPLIAGVPVTDILQYVIGAGSVKLYRAFTVAIFGSMLSVLMQKTGVAESFIKMGAELAGDNPWVISVLMMLLIAALFTTLGGLGAVIMVGTIILPVLLSLGVGTMTAAGIFLFGFSIGGIMNVGNWAVYIDVLGMSVETIRPYALSLFLLAFAVGIVYISIQLYRDGHSVAWKKLLVKLLIIGAIVCGVYLLIKILNLNLKEYGQFIGTVLKKVLEFGIYLLFILAFVERIVRRRNPEKIYWAAYFTPIMPLLLILLFNMDFIAAFICGLLFGYIATYKKGHLNLFVKSMFEGGSVVMPAVVMFFGIGMLLNAIMGPGGEWLATHPEGWPVLNLLRPLMESIVPQNGLQYVLIFSIAAPLALYRGPLNIWGMGYGIAAVLIASGLNAGGVMGMLLAVGQIQGISDPTNTHNVWLANELHLDVQKILRNTLPFSWMLAILGLMLAVVFF